jgi:hypothetical protein
MSARFATDTVRIDQCRYLPGESRFTTVASNDVRSIIFPLGQAPSEWVVEI